MYQDGVVVVEALQLKNRPFQKELFLGSKIFAISLCASYQDLTNCSGGRILFLVRCSQQIGRQRLGQRRAGKSYGR